jgi:hypothetical protein
VRSIKGHNILTINHTILNKKGENHIRFSKHPFIWDIPPFFFFLFGKISPLSDKENCTANPAKDFLGKKIP